MGGFANARLSAKDIANELGLKYNNVKTWKRSGCPCRKYKGRFYYTWESLAEWKGTEQLIALATENGNSELADYLISLLPPSVTIKESHTGMDLSPAYGIERGLEEGLEEGFDADSPMSFEAARAKKMVAEAGLKEIALAKEQGLAVEVPDVRKAWLQVIYSVRQKLLSIPSRVAPLVEACETRNEIEELLSIKIREALLGLANDEVGSGKVK